MAWSDFELQMAIRSGIVPQFGEPPPAEPAPELEDPLATALESEDLGRPYIPQHLLGHCTRREGWLFSSRDDIADVYELRPLIAEYLDDADPGDYLACGHNGHGFSSYVFSYALVEGGLGLFLQVPWYGPGSNDSRGMARVESLSLWTHFLIEDCRAAVAAGRVPADSRLIVVDTLSSHWWGWISPAGIERHDTLNVLYDVSKALLGREA